MARSEPQEPETEDPRDAEMSQQQEATDGEERAPELDAATRARHEAALRHVRVFGDPVLRSRALAVERFDASLRDEIERMGSLMADALGVGLAATQVGILHRVLVYRVAPDSPVIGLVNPELEWAGAELETMEEGCLSIPGVHVDVERPLHIRVGARDPDGAPLTIEACGLEARVLQHEIDHLDGTLMLDRASREQRKEAMRAMREAEQAARAA